MNNAEIAKRIDEAIAALSAGLRATSSAPERMPSGDQLREIVQSARTSASDGASPSEYVLAGWRAALSTTQTQPSDAQDAARYRWLRDMSEPGICAFYLSVGKAFDGVKFTRKTVDQAIDAQIVEASAGTGKDGGQAL